MSKSSGSVRSFIKMEIEKNYVEPNTLVDLQPNLTLEKSDSFSELVVSTDGLLKEEEQLSRMLSDNEWENKNDPDTPSDSSKSLMIDKVNFENSTEVKKQIMNRLRKYNKLVNKISHEN